MSLESEIFEKAQRGGYASSTIFNKYLFMDGLFWKALGNYKSWGTTSVDFEIDYAHSRCCNDSQNIITTIKPYVFYSMMFHKNAIEEGYEHALIWLDGLLKV